MICPNTQFKHNMAKLKKWIHSYEMGYCISYAVRVFGKMNHFLLTFSCFKMRANINRECMNSFV